MRLPKDPLTIIYLIGLPVAFFSLLSGSVTGFLMGGGMVAYAMISWCWILMNWEPESANLSPTSPRKTTEATWFMLGLFIFLIGGLCGSLFTLIIGFGIMAFFIARWWWLAMTWEPGS